MKYQLIPIMSSVNNGLIILLPILIMLSPSTIAQEALTYSEALQRLHAKSDAIKAAGFQVASEKDKRRSLNRLDLPSLSVSAGILAYGSEREFDIAPLQQVIGQALPQASGSIPSKIDLDFNDSSLTAALTSTWLLYTGGRTQAARRFADAEIDFAQGAQRGTLEQQEKVLATVYFGHLLAAKVMKIRENVLLSLGSHLHQAKRFEDTGVLSKVERMHAQVAFDEARRNVEKARADFTIADKALQHLLRSKIPVKPQTPLFVSTNALKPLSEFINAGFLYHPQLTMLRAKRKQSVQAKVAEQALWKPTIAAYGAYNLAPRDASFSDPLPLLEPDWIVGINISFPIFSRQNRNSRISAANQQVRRLAALEKELMVGIKTRIEGNYRLVEKQRTQYLLLQSSIELTKEALLLRERMFTEGLSTSLEVVDARLAVAKVETERAVAAYNFVTSLLNLLETSGELNKFVAYIARADIRLPLEENER